MTWACEAHNRVNIMLGKPTFSCDEMSLHLRWRAARPECRKNKEVGGSDDGGGDAVET
jgi:hypothetical protein